MPRSRTSTTPLGWWFALLCLLSYAPTLALSEEVSHHVPRLPPLTKIEQIRQLTRQQAALGPEVSLRAVVTYYDPAFPEDLFLQDATAGIWVDSMGGPNLNLHAGDLVEVRGVAEWTDFAPDVGKPHIRVVGRAPLPMAPQASFSNLTSTAVNGRRFQVEGIVLDATKQGETLRLTLQVDGGIVNARILGVKGPVPANLVDAKVRVRGVCGAMFNKKNQLIGVRLCLPSLADLQVKEEGPKDPFARPVHSISSLLHFVPKEEPGRIKVRGVVTLQQGGHGLFIQDGNDGLFVESNQRTPLAVGDYIEVAGFPSVSQRLSPILQYAIFRSLGKRPPIEPHLVTPLEVLQGNHDADLVRIKGRLLRQAESHGEQVLTLEADSASFEVELRPQNQSQFLPPFEIGSLLETTGICSVNADENGGILGFRILLRSRPDISVLHTPPWWTLQHALEALGIMMLVIVAAATWVFVLKRRVKRQTDIIRQRYEGQAALEAQYSEAQRLAHVGSWQEEFATQRATWSEETFRIFGYQPGEVTPSREALMARVHPNDQKLIHKVIEEALQGSFSEKEFRIRRPCGEERFVISGVKVVLDAHGRPTRMFGVVQDITERKRVEKSLEERTAYLNALIENSPLAIVVVDSENRVQLCNPAFERLFLYRREEIAGAQVNELIAPPELLHEAMHISRRVEKEGEAVQITTRRCRKDGTLVDVELYGVPLTVGGKLVGVYGLYVDITERKKGELELQKAKEAAEAANRAKSVFLANMSHEIRTPMNGILGMTDLALESDLTPLQRENLGMVKASAECLLNIIDDILDFSKIEAGKLGLEALEFNLRDALESTLKFLGLRAHEKGLELEGHVEPSVPQVLIGDSGRLRQILVNLTSNAIKFTERGKIFVRVERESEEQSPGELHFSVADSGIGIPPDKQAAIFDAFTQVDGSTARRYGGSGLGLTISKRLVEMMGGRIWVESAPGKGSTFHFTVQLQVSASTRPSQAVSARAPSRSARAAQERRLRVMLVEDNAINQTLALRLLEKHGHRVTVVGDGRKALATLGQENFDLVLMDVQMPEMDGFEATAAIRDKEQCTGGHLPIIAMTAHAMKGDRERCLSAGMDGYIAKPIHRQELFTVIDDVLKQEGQSPSEDCGP